MGLCTDFLYCIAFAGKIKEVFSTVEKIFHPPHRRPDGQKPQTHQLHRRVGPELPQGPQQLRKAGDIQHRPAQGPHQQKPSRLPLRPPQQKDEGRRSHGQGVPSVQHRGAAAEPQAEGPQEVIAHRRPGPQQDGLEKQPALGHISRRDG